MAQTDVDWLKDFTEELRQIGTSREEHYQLRDSDSIIILLYKTAIRLWPGYEHALNNVANVLRKRKEHMFQQQAHDLLIKALECNPKFSAAWMNLGIVQGQLGKLDLAEHSYLNAISLRGDAYPDAHFNLGTLYLKFKTKNDMALHQFEEALSQDNSHFSAWSNKVILLDEMGRLKKAQTAAEEAKLLFPEKPEFYFHLGYISISNFEEIPNFSN